VLAGAGPHFCAGVDMRFLQDPELVPALHRLLDVIVTIPVPVIAMVHGAALGAGTQLAIASDLRVVAPNARFAITAAKLGLMINHWTVQRLALLAGHGPARSMLLAAEELDARQPCDWGSPSARAIWRAPRPGRLSWQCWGH
ncbi:MAG: enoyl-CoA hydratase-related protein, partial [Pseudonocardiaceae bacterium]